jgi:hypothetical protein
MADKTIGQEDAIAIADVLEGACFEIENVGGAEPLARRLPVSDARFVVHDATPLTAATAAQLSATAYFLAQDAVLATPASRNVRKIVLAEMQKLMASRAKVYQCTARAKVGTTAGWVVGAADNLGKMATLPAAQAGSTLVVPISGLKVGDIITAFNLVGSIQSGGNHATIIADLRTLTAAVAGAVDASAGVMAAALDVVANTIISNANAVKVGLAITVTEGVSYYVLITATTAAACTEELQAVEITVTGQ